MKLNTLREPKFNALIIESNLLETEKLRAWQKASSVPFKSRCEGMINRLAEENKRLSRRSEAIQKAVADNVTDAEILEMIRLFQNGKTWLEINSKIYGYRDYQACRKRVERAVAGIDFE